MQTETRAYIITMTINTAHASIYATAWTGSFAFYFLYKAVHAVGQEFPSSREVIQAGQDYSTNGTTLQAVRDARSCRIQSHRSIGPLRLRPAYNPTPYRVNDDSPAANDSNSFHPRSPLGCWLAYM